MVNESYSVYPDNIDGYATLPLRRNLVDEIRAEDHNRLRDAIVKIEQELGVQPSGTWATVADRLDNIADARAVIDAHMADPEDAHDSSAISVADSDDLFFYNNVEKVIEELGLLLPHKPDCLGENLGYVPNDGIPSFVDGYGTKFIYNMSDWSGEQADTDLKRTQMRSVNGIRGIHVFDVSAATNDGTGFLTYDQSNTTLRWQAPGDSQPGATVDVSGLSEGEWETVYSYDTTKSLRFARTDGTLPTGAREELLEVYALEAVQGEFTIPGQEMKTTKYITRTATSSSGTSRHQFMISGTVFPADLGTLVLQRKRRNDDDFYPIAVLDLKDNFNNTLRKYSQPVYIPTLEDFDTITLYDRISVRRDYNFEYKDAAGSNIYEDCPIDYYHHQLGKYLIPISNEDIVGGKLESPASADDFNEVHTKVSAYRLVHYKDGITDFTAEPDWNNTYSMSDEFADQSDGDNNVRFSNLFVDSNTNRPGIEHFWFVFPRSKSDSTDTMFLSGIKYYTKTSVDDIKNRFGFRVQTNDSVFNSTYLKEGMLRFKTNVFDFPNGVETTGDGYSKWGATVDVGQLLDDPNDGYAYFSSSNLPEFDNKAWYRVDDGYHTTRKLKIPENEFSARAHISVWAWDPFGPGDGYDAYGDQFAHMLRDRILVNSYPSRSTAVQEYFTDEDYRIGEGEEFLFQTNAGNYTYSGGVHIVGGTGDDGYVLCEWNREIPIGSQSLQCAARWTDDEIDTCGLIYPQSNYTLRTMLPLQINEFFDDDTGDYEVYTDTLPSYDGYYSNYGVDGELANKYYQRLFSLGYSINNARLRVVSEGNNPVAFKDIAYYNSDRFAKIEVKIPGPFTTSGTEWMDISRLFSSGCYEEADGVELTYSYGALHGKPTGGAGDFVVPFTFGTRNNADSGNMVAVKVTYFAVNDSGRDVLYDTKTRIITMLELLPPITT